MIDFPIDELLSETACEEWLEKQLHPQGLKCPKCGSEERRIARRAGPVLAYRCMKCDCYHTIFTNTVFEKTRQKPSKIVMILRGIAKGETTARLARELAISRKQLATLRQRIQLNLYNTLPTGKMAGSEFEADELFQNAGEKGTPHLDPDDPPRRRANKKKGTARMKTTGHQ